MTRSRLLLLSIASGLLLFLSWPAAGFAPLIFVSWLPLLAVEHYFFLQYKSSENNIGRGKKKCGWSVFAYACLSFLTWNACTTWWIWNSTEGGAVMAVTANSLLMALTFLFYHRTKRGLGAKYAWLILPAYWITFEYIHMHWDISWTWLTLGNVFAKYYNMVQWYEYTGVFGGSLWVLGTNLLIFYLLLHYKRWTAKKKTGFVSLAAAAILIPLLCSYGVMAKIMRKNSGSGNMVQVVVVQPNIDPYNEKFSGNYEEQLQKMLQLAGQKLDTGTDYLVFPETALQESIWEDELNQTYSMRTLNEFIKKYPRLKIIVGASTARTFKPGEKISSTARKFRQVNTWYDDYNTAFQVDRSGIIKIYHKSILVPGVEKMPFPYVLWWLEDLAIKMGGSSGSLGVQDERTVFMSPDKNIGVAPVICYESVYGEFVSLYVRNGAGLIFIITNDGWWGDTPGYKQHLAYASLRAIETRRCLARAANTGISCFINQLGEQSQNTKWWQPAVIKSSLSVYTDETFYTKHGDYIAVFFCGVSIVLILYAFYFRFRRK